MNILTKNYWSGRFGFKPEAVVLHITDGSLQSVVNHFGNPKSYVSAHWVIDSEVYSCVDERDTAWHAGVVRNPTWKGLNYKKLGGFDGAIEDIDARNRGEQGEVFQELAFNEYNLGSSAEVINPNFYSIGIEVISMGEFPGLSKWIRVAKKVKEVCDRWDIPLNNIGIVNHNEIRSDKWCPGNWFKRSWILTLIKIFV